MSTIGIKDPEYLAYIEKLPCAICGHIPIGDRKVYNEYLDEYKKYPCKNTAHHVDTEMTRTKNDHRIIPLCSHYVISGRNTLDCHQKVHADEMFKSTKARDEFVKLADEYYEIYCEK